MAAGGWPDYGAYMTVAALIVAAGRGVRAGGPVPKQYQLLAGRPVLAHCLARFAGVTGIDHVRVVIAAEDGPAYAEATAGFDLAPPVIGGATRQASVRAGLEALAPVAPTKVLIHDAARPLVPREVISAVVNAIDAEHGAMAALPVADTLKRGSDESLTAGPDRAGLWRAQTPQGFPYAAILEAHRRFADVEVTDDAALAERIGLPVRAVPGSERNLKLTTADDMQTAARLLAAELADVRVGHGFDAHAFGEPRPLMLCGVAVPHDRGLAGHSDADVGLHALTDAILGALGEADIGQHFPPSDPAWKGAASARFLAHAAELVARRGGIIAHVDVTLICERPRIGPHREAMRAAIAETLRLPLDRVSVKATTTERLGFTGRGEGIAAQATATVRLPL